MTCTWGAVPARGGRCHYGSELFLAPTACFIRESLSSILSLPSIREAMFTLQPPANLALPFVGGLGLDLLMSGETSMRHSSGRGSQLTRGSE